MGYGEEGEMGYRIWIPELRKVIRSRDVVFNKAKLLKNNVASHDDPKKVKFQHAQSPIRSPIGSHDAPQMIGYDNEPVLIEPDDVGQQNEAFEGNFQPHIDAEIGL